MKTRLIVFDIDDTLTNTAEMHIRAFIESLKELGVDNMDTNFGEYKHHTDSYISKAIYEKEMQQVFTPTLRTKFEELLTKKILLSSISEIKGAGRIIKALQNQEQTFVCFATGSLRRAAAYKLKSIGVEFAKELLVASDEIEERENIVRKAIDETKRYVGSVSFDKIVAVGDGLWDLKTANNLNLDFIGIGDKNKEILLANGCKKHYKNFENVETEDF